MTDFTELPAPTAERIGAAIRAALPADPGWHVSYRIVRESAHIAADEAGLSDYEWKIWHDDFDRLGTGPGLAYYEAFAAGRWHVAFTYGNTDHGVANRPIQAVLLPLTLLETLLAAVLRDRVRYPPNRYGYT